MKHDDSWRFAPTVTSAITALNFGCARRAESSFATHISLVSAVTLWTKHGVSIIVVKCHSLTWGCLSLPKRFDVLFLPE
jgi:hypothetical protein